MTPIDLLFTKHKYTAVLTKVVQKKRNSVRNNAERWSGKYPINFNKSSESIMP